MIYNPGTQATLASDVTIKGIGIHTGQKCTVRVFPADEDSGVVFRCNGTRIKASPFSVVDTTRGTTLGKDGCKVVCVEHLLAALAGVGIDNAECEMHGPELPVLDGSALPFAQALQAAGVTEQSKARREYTVTTPDCAPRGQAFVAVSPGECAEFNFLLRFNHPLIGLGFGRFDSTMDFMKDIAPARTFGLASEGEKLRAAGLALGASEENALIVYDDEVRPKMRFPDEFVRHKILDMIGDLALVGGAIRGKFLGVASGHWGNVEIGRRILKSTEQGVAREGVAAMDSLRDDQQGPSLGALRDRYGMMDVEQIRSVLPHRYPFLLVDRILSLEDGKRARGQKNVTINEQFFEGHFPGHAVMPGVLIVEAMAQVGGVLLLSLPENRGKLAYFAGIDKVRFKKPVLPGDTLITDVELLWARGTIGKVTATSRVEGTVVAQGELMFGIVDRDEFVPSEDQQPVGVGK